jgi:hypothetical protein
MKKPKKKAATPIHLDDFGCVNELRFKNGGWARVQMNSLEIRRLIGALEKWILRRHKIPPPEILQALDVFQHYISDPRRFDVCIIADMIMAVHGVSLEPIFPPIEELLPKKPKPGKP